SGADPPLVFKRWTNVVLLRAAPPVGPSCEPIDCSKRQAMAPLFGQLGSEPARIEAGEGGSVECESGTCAQTLLVSKELCHVALPKGSGSGAASLGFVSGLRKWVMTWKFSPRKL